MSLMYNKITNGGYSYYIHILKVPPHERGGGTLPPLLLGHSLPPYKSNQQDQYGGGIQNNLEIYRNLEGAIYTSPVQKMVNRDISL